MAFYGLSTESLKLAERLAKKHEVTLIDENLKLAIPFRGKGFTLNSLFDRDLLPLTSYKETLSKADIIFFSPKMRKVGMEGRGDLLMWLKEVSHHMSEGSTLVYLLPLAIRKSQEVLALLEDQSGLKEGEGFHFLYFPLTPDGDPQGFVGSSREGLPREIHRMLGRPEIVPYYLAEIKHFKNIFPGILERAMKLAFQEPDGELYISEAVKGLLDAHLLASSVSTSNPSFHIASSMIKGVNYYLKTLENFLRQLVKRMGLKAIRTHVLLLWNNDPYELRGDEYRTKATLQARLREAFGTVEVPMLLSSSTPIFPLVEKSNIIVVCSKKDEEEIRRLKKTKGVIKATAPPSFLNP